MSAVSAVPHVIDCRRLALRDDARVVIQAFDALVPGESLRLTFAEPPWRLLGTLQRARAGTFNWSPLQDGPPAWLVELERRPAAIGAPREVTEALERDHARLDELEQAAFEARSAGRPSAAAEAVAWFAYGVRRHIAIEERLVYPEFERRSGIGGDQGITTALRGEHGAIGAILILIERDIADPRAPVELSRAALRRLVAEHVLREHRVLYPAIERLLGAEESDRLVARMQGWTGA